MKSSFVNSVDYIMCGIAGYYGTSQISEQVVRKTLEAMARRGPDNQSSSRAEFGGRQLTLLHSRLAIIDRGKEANQPLENSESMMVFNGEIYNYVELTKEYLKSGEIFNTHSDSEVLFKTLARYRDPKRRYRDLDGMWSVAFFDKKSGQLTLSRDFFGEKPLYIYKCSHGIYFGSSPAYIQHLAQSSLRVNYEKLRNFLHFDFRAFEANANSFALDVTSVAPGCELRIDCDGAISEESFFSPHEGELKEWGFDEAKGRLLDLLDTTIQRRFRSDVPVALFLSGGLDSGVVSYFASRSASRVKCFSIASSDSRYDESEAIDDLVECFGLDHEYLTPSYEAEDVLERLVHFSRENFSPIPFQNYLLFSDLIRRAKVGGAKVVLTGLGGDELFAGYLSHWRFYFYSIRDEECFSQEYERFKKLTYGYIRNPELRDFQFDDADSFRPESFFEGSSAVRAYFKESPPGIRYPTIGATSVLKQKLNIDLTCGTLPPHLQASDQVSMFYSVESRSPLLSRPLFEFARSLPDGFLMKDGYGKYIMRKALDGKLPGSLVNDRNKKGFNFDFSKNNISGLPSLIEAAAKNDFISENVDFVKIRHLLKTKDTLTNDESKLLFRIASIYGFLK
jgi:asparagine synthase (glutamine-hydrolysing)